MLNFTYLSAQLYNNIWATLRYRQLYFDVKYYIIILNILYILKYVNLINTLISGFHPLILTH